MKYNYKIKILVVGIIVLFLGVGFQPALANEISDVEEDCGCQPVSRVDLLKVKLLLIRLEAFTNVILSKYEHIPEIQEECGEILDRITSLREMNDEFESHLLLNDEHPWCKFLMPIGNTLTIIIFTLIDLTYYFENNPILLKIIGFLGFSLLPLYTTVLALVILYDCIEPYP